MTHKARLGKLRGELNELLCCLDKLESSDDSPDVETIKALVSLAGALDGTLHRLNTSLLKDAQQRWPSDPIVFEWLCYHWARSPGGEEKSYAAAKKALQLTLDHGGYLKRSITNYITAALVANEKEEMAAMLASVSETLLRKGEDKDRILKWLDDKRLSPDIKDRLIKLFK